MGPQSASEDWATNLLGSPPSREVLGFPGKVPLALGDPCVKKSVMRACEHASAGRRSADPTFFGRALSDKWNVVGDLFLSGLIKEDSPTGVASEQQNKISGPHCGPFFPPSPAHGPAKGGLPKICGQQMPANIRDPRE